MDLQAPAPPLPDWVRNALQLNDEWVVFMIPQHAHIRLEYVEFWSQRLDVRISSNEGTGYDCFVFHVLKHVGEAPITENTFESPAAKDRFVTLLQRIPIKGDQLETLYFFGDNRIPSSFFPDFWETLGHLKTRKLNLLSLNLTGEGHNSAFCNFLQAQDRPDQEEEGQAFFGLQRLCLEYIFVDSDFKHHLGHALGHMTHLEEIQLRIRLAFVEESYFLCTDFAVPKLLASAQSLRKIGMDPVGDTKILESLGRDFPALENLKIFPAYKNRKIRFGEDLNIQKAFESNTRLLSLDVRGCLPNFSSSIGRNINTNLANFTTRNKRLKQLKESKPTLPYEAWAQCIHRLGQPLIEQEEGELLRYPHAGKSALFHFLRETFVPGHPKLLQPEQTDWIAATYTCRKREKN